MHSRTQIPVAMLGALFCLPLAAVEFEGYPYNVMAKIANYDCQLTPIPKVEAKAPLSALNPSFVELCIANDFKDRPKEVMRSAFLRLLSKLSETDFYHCVSNNLPAHAKKGALASDASVFSRLRGTAFLMRPADGFGLPAHVFVSNLAAGTRPQQLGDGYPDYFDIQSKEEIYVVSVAARGDLVGAERIPNSGKLDFWSAVLGMALAKNLGISDEPPSQGISGMHTLGRCLFDPKYTEDAR